MKNTAIYVLLILILAIAIFVFAYLYSHNKKKSDTLALCKIVFDTFYDENLKNYNDGYKIGPQGLRIKLVTSVQHDNKLYSLLAYRHPEYIVDSWENGIFVIKYGNGIRVRSNGPDGIADTNDDIEYK